MDLDTSMGGNQSRFPETRRSAVIDFNSGDPALRDCAAEALIAAYWKPVYKYIRVRWRRSNEDAKDLTQGFFAAPSKKNFSAITIRRKRGFARICGAVSTRSWRARTRLPGASSAAARRTSFRSILEPPKASSVSTTWRRASCRRKNIPIASGYAMCSPWRSMG